MTLPTQVNICFNDR